MARDVQSFFIIHKDILADGLCASCILKEKDTLFLFYFKIKDWYKNWNDKITDYGKK